MSKPFVILITVLPLVCCRSAGGEPRAYTIEQRQVGPAEFFVASPSGYRIGQRPALVICLHGTDTNARDILSFWLSLEHPYPMLLVAPQSSGRGWRDGDAACVFAALETVRGELTFDESRVLLTGHSAGGAMAFYLAYERRFPATAVATTANYLPPSVTAEQIRARSDLPVYYAVGTRDINRRRMRAGIILLRSNGSRVGIDRPEIGHVLDRATTQKATVFFAARNRQHVDRVLSAADQHVESDRPGAALALLEPIVESRRYYRADEVTDARQRIERIEQSAEPRIARAEALARRGDPRAAADELLNIERRFAGGKLADRLAKRREAFLADAPEAGSSVDLENAREIEARRLLDLALRLTRQRKFEQAREKCRILQASYPGTTAAAGGRRLQRQLDLHAAP